jgi:ribA/ribD-fused uncharacterized protein
MNKIDSFRGEYRFLSNFHRSDIIFEQLSFMSVEAAYQSAKTNNKAEKVQFTDMKAGEAKTAGRELKIRHDWDEIKIGVMYECLKLKFFDRVLRMKLLDTGDAELVEGNNWNDTFWGQCGGVGENHLGKLLMKVREEIRNENS